MCDVRCVVGLCTHTLLVENGTSVPKQTTCGASSRFLWRMEPPLLLQVHPLCSLEQTWGVSFMRLRSPCYRISPQGQRLFVLHESSHVVCVLSAVLVPTFCLLDLVGADNYRAGVASVR